MSRGCTGVPGFFVRQIPGFVRRIPGLSRWVFSRWGFMLSDSPGGSLCCRMLPAGSFVVGFLRLFADGPVDPVCVKNSGKHPEKGCFPFDCRSEQGGWPDGRWYGGFFRLSGASVVPAAPARLALRGLPLAAGLLPAAPYFLPFTFHFSLSVNPCEMKVSIGSRPVGP